MAFWDDLFGDPQKEANRANASWRQRGANMLAPTDPDFIGQYTGLKRLASPMLSQLMAQQDLMGQIGANSAMAGLSRAGLGNTGLGAALGGGLRAGAAFQGNQLRARMLMDLLGMTQNIQGARGSLLAGITYQPAKSSLQNALSFIGQGAQAVDAWKQGN